jgi:AmpD protein
MSINIDSGLLDDCILCPSPNQDDRPHDSGIDLVVIHSISLPPGQYGGDAIERFFSNQLDRHEHPYFEEIHDLQVSSHLLIKRDGSIIQFVPFHKRAWHAGVSDYCGRQRCNDFSIGIELEGTDSDSFDERQYLALASVIHQLKQTYPAIKNNLAGHSDIAPGRKTDPGTGFDWQHLQQLLEKTEI